MEATFNRNLRICATCQYWTGHSVRVKSPALIKCDRDEKATCNIIGVEKRACNSCGKHKKRCNL